MSFSAQITYFICIKQSSQHSPNLPDSPNLPYLHNTHQTCLSRVWRVLTKRFGKCLQVWRVLHISEKGHFGEYSHSLNLHASCHCLNYIHTYMFSKQNETTFLRLCRKFTEFFFAQSFIRLGLCVCQQDVKERFLYMWL
jgi:hypothetical protein